MVIQITNSCTFNCPHCMQGSSPEPQHMTKGMFDQCMITAWKMGARVIEISGGEPTTHPDWYEFVTQACHNPFHSVVLITNGGWLGTETYVEKMLELCRRMKNFKIQVTSIRRFYTGCDFIRQKADEFKQLLKKEGLKRKFYIQTEDNLHLVSHGRALEHPELLEEAANDMANTTSCLMGAMVAVQTPDIKQAIKILEDRGKFCKPFVDWKGGIHWSEVWTCPAFASVFDPIEEISRKAREWRPCMKCADWKKVEARSTKDQEYAIAKFLFSNDQKTIDAMRQRRPEDVR